MSNFFTSTLIMEVWEKRKKKKRKNSEKENALGLIIKKKILGGVSFLVE